MRAYLPSYELTVPRTLGEALALLREEPGAWRPFAGGTDLMVLLEAGRLEHRKFFSIRHLAELRGVGEEPDGRVRVGALTTYADVRRSDLLAGRFPMLAQAARETGGVAIQNRGTVGGNIANASPAADTPPALLAYGAEVELVSAAGSRRVPYEGFHTGYKRTVMRDDELIAAVLLPRPAEGARHFYRKVGTRRAQAISKVCFAALAEAGEGGAPGEVRVAVGSVAPVVLRCRRTEEALKELRAGGEAARAAVEELGREVTPIDDVRSTARYRRRVAQNLLAEFLSGLSS
ncbi:MAG TPA: xanthine dehydrogenase family protein subunit M [Pyrinomonadaceae bacterium]|jgi:CO/xanthine dehydrogenase FAD-binding subunit